MANKTDLSPGQRVRFRRSHDKAVELTGKIVKVHEDEDVVDVQVEPDGKLAEVETTETAHVDDITPLEEVAADSSARSKRGRFAQSKE